MKTDNWTEIVKVSTGTCIEDCQRGVPLEYRDGIVEMELVDGEDLKCTDYTMNHIY